MKVLGKREGEHFVGNVSTSVGIPSYLKPLKTARLGVQALDIDGNPLDPREYRPLFIGTGELMEYNRIMDGRVGLIRRSAR